jgi:tRNA(fMet)-specific endonuclease VapC
VSAKLLLDTDILSALMRKDVKATLRARTYIEEFGQLSFSEITRYEILRGLKAKGAEKQERAFVRLCDRCAILPVTGEVAFAAAETYADLAARGQLIGDADILIAATALVRGLGVATNNEDHFARIRGLSVENWLR